MSALLELIKSLLPQNGKKVPVFADIQNETSFGQVTRVALKGNRILVDASIINWDSPDEPPTNTVLRNRSIRSFGEGVVQDVAMCLLENK